MPRRVIHKMRDPEKGRIFIAITLLGLAGLAGMIWLLVVNVGNNRDQIAKQPTREELLRVLDANRADQRRACRVVNQRFGAIRVVLKTQRPSPRTTAYYQTHPFELERAQRQFDQILEVFGPRECLRDYPVPNITEITLPEPKAKPQPKGGDHPANGHRPAQPP